MAFSADTHAKAFKRSGGQCECTRQHAGMVGAPHHGGRCPKRLTGNQDWHAHHKTAVKSGGTDDLGNCEVLCIPCHQLTETYGSG